MITPVGPHEDADRAWDTVRSIAHWEPAVRWIVMIDDAAPDEERDLTALDVGDVSLVSLRNPLPHGGASMYERVASAAMLGFQWIARNTDADTAMIIDSDSLVIAPFADKIEKAFAENPDVGLFGSYDVDCNGAPRDFDSWAPTLRRLARVVQSPRRVALGGRAATVRRLVLDAREKGMIWGEHVLGCALAFRREPLDQWRDEGLLDDPLLFLGTPLSYDPILAILIRRSGYRQAGLVGPGDPFGVSWHGLPDLPERLLERGHSIIHSTKNDTRVDEPTIREFFRGLRLADAAS